MNTNTLYYYPENHGLEKVGELDGGESYDYNLLVIWKHIETGKIYWATSSGCSCSIAFEEYEFKSHDNTDLHVMEFSKREFELAVEAFNVEMSQKITLLDKVRQYHG